MSVRLEDDAVFLEGACGVEDAEPLLALLQEDRGRTADLSRAESLHTAVVQVLLARSPTLRGRIRDPFLEKWIIPIISQPGGALGG